MFLKTRNVLLLSIAAVSLYGGSMEYGSGDIDITSGIFGYNSTSSIDLSSYSLVEHHKNLFSSTWYYRYNITWFDSKKLVKQQDNFNSVISNLSASNTIQNVEYRMQGLDASLALGKDLYHKSENRFISLGLMIGISLPWVDSKSDSSSNNSTSDQILDGLNNSKTTLYTYKIGPTLSASYDFNKYFMIYGSATYAYQTGKIKNDYLDSSFQADGIFSSYDVGLKIQPFAHDYKTKLMTFKTRLYATLGYRYSKWELNDINLDTFAFNFQTSAIDFDMQASTAYVGIGYDFF